MDGMSILQIVLGIFGYTAIAMIGEVVRTRHRLRKGVEAYVRDVNRQWTGQPQHFVLMNKVRAFERLLREVQMLQPRSIPAHRMVERVREEVEWVHRGAVWRDGVPMEPARLDQFPYVEGVDDSVESTVREHVLDGLRKIRWLRLGELERTTSGP